LCDISRRVFATPPAAAGITSPNVETSLGRFPCFLERPEPQKFAWPIVLLPELFTTAAHLAVMLGYLATIGWEVYAPDLRAGAGRNGTPELSRLGFADLVTLGEEALDALGRPAVAIGHGLGGLLALKLAETRPLKAAVALAPLVPGLPNRLVTGWSKLAARLLGHPLSPPGGRTLFEFLFDVEPFQRAAMVKALVPDATAAARDVVSGNISFAALQDLPPRLVIAGEVDTFAPLEKVTAFAQSIAAATIVAKGRGHWLIGGRGLERTIGEAHRYLVRSLGQDLLLLFPEEWKSNPEDGETSA
jgi:pimeloyl-ACP methyl ester carboxylesterase